MTYIMNDDGTNYECFDEGIICNLVDGVCTYCGHEPADYV